MVIAKFNKIGAFAFNSYLDCRDVIVQTIRRAGINVGYSQGFNPHELIYFSPPTSLGIESYCEYMYLVTDLDANFFKELFNNYSPYGLQILKAKTIDKKPDFYNLIDLAKYKIILSNEVDLAKINFLYKDNEIEEDISLKIHEMVITNNEVETIIACGQKENLKPSKLLKCLQNSFNVKIEKIEKTALLKKEENLIFDIDKFLFD